VHVIFEEGGNFGIMGEREKEAKWENVRMKGSAKI
jgi:hypothetical protein